MTDQWDGDKAKQAAIFRAMCADFTGHEVIDVIGACQTAIANIVANCAPSYEAAIEGVDSIAADIKQTIATRYARSASEGVRQ